MANTPFNESQSTQQTTQAPNYGFGTTVDAPFEETVAHVTEALKNEGFGVLTTIDVKATMKAKLNVDFERYTILGACNPQLAHRALELEHNVGLLLPCNVVVHEAHEGSGATRTRVDIADPVAMLGVIQNPAMQELASEARTRLERVVVSLNASK